VSFQAEVDRLEGTEKSTQKLTFIDVYHKGSWRLDSGRIEHLASSRSRVRNGLAAPPAG
jgi:hypothetical protein